MTFINRIGATNYCLPYSEKGIKRSTTGSIKLSITKDTSGNYYSAGLFGEMAKEGTYTFQVFGRLDWMDPSAVFAIWTYSDANKDEIDLIENTRWGDKNNPYTFNVGMFKQEVQQAPGKFLGRAFNRHRFTLTIKPQSIDLMAEGEWKQTNDWKITYQHSMPRVITDLGQIRIALWIPKTGFTFSDVASRGTMSVLLEKVTYTPLAVATTGIVL